MLTRRTLLLAPLVLLPDDALAVPRADALLIGDSLAYQLGPRLQQRARAYARRTHTRSQGGSSTRQWVKQRWASRAVSTVRTPRVLVSLGVNCLRAERPRLARDIALVADLIRDQGAEPLWLLPPPLKRLSTDYLHLAVAESEVPSFAPGSLKLEPDGVHPTVEGHRRWALLLSLHLWGEPKP